MYYLQIQSKYMKHETYFGNEMFITKNKDSLKNNLWSIETNCILFHKSNHMSSPDSKHNTTDTDSNENSDNDHSNNSDNSDNDHSNKPLCSNDNDEDVLDEVLPWTLPVKSINN